MKENKSAARALDLLNLLAESEEALTLLEIERALNIPKSSTFELVYTLVDKGFVENIEKKFSIGVMAFKVGISYSRKLDIVQMSKSILEELSKQCEETVFLAKYIGDKLVYVDKHMKYSELSSTCRIGSTKELYCTALGKAILSSKTDQEIIDYFGRAHIVKHTKNTLDNPQSMIEQAAVFRKQGYAIEDREGSDDMYCVACPIYNYQNIPVAAVSVATPYYKMTAETSSKFGNLVNRAAFEVSNKLGFTGRNLF